MSPKFSILCSRYCRVTLFGIMMAASQFAAAQHHLLYEALPAVASVHPRPIDAKADSAACPILSGIIIWLPMSARRQTSGLL